MTSGRREFMAAAAALSSLSLSANSHEAATPAMSPHKDEHASHEHPKPVRPAIPRLPAVLCRTTATTGIDSAYKMLAAGRNTLEAALCITTMQENDPNDTSTGLGGLPNEEGDVELDACCFHGPSRRSAAVAAVCSGKNPSLLAQALMDRTGYSLLVGENATNFASAQASPKKICSRTEEGRAGPFGNK